TSVPLRSEEHTTNPASPATSADATAPRDLLLSATPDDPPGVRRSARPSSLWPWPPPVQWRGECPPTAGTPAPPAAHCFRSAQRSSARLALAPRTTAHSHNPSASARG